MLNTDLRLKGKQAFWETPRNVVLIVAAIAGLVGVIAGWLGYQIGRMPPVVPQVVFQPGSIVVQQPAPPTR